MNKKNILRAILGLGLIVGIYYAAIQYWVWKWETPHDPLPAGHLSFSQMTQFEATDDHWARMAQQEMTDLAERLQSVSISGALSIDGEMVWAGAVGLSNVEKMLPATMNTQYRIGSVSKSLTGVTLMRMVEEGMIDLDADIHEYLPNYPVYDAPMTVRQLANHMAGVRHYNFDITSFPPSDFYSNVPNSGVDKAIEQFKNDDLLFTPGLGFNYSTHGYTLLSAVMQAAGGKAFDRLVADLVSGPLGMTSTGAEHLLPRDNDLAGFYTSDDGLYGATQRVNLSNKLAGGGFVSTPTDMVRMATALLNNELLSSASFDALTTPQPMHDGSDNPQSYGIGWRHYETSRVFDENNMVDVILHGGVAAGSDSILVMVPDHNIAVAFASNGQGEITRGELQLLAYRLAGLVINSK